MDWSAFAVDAAICLGAVWLLLTATFAVALRVGRHAVIDVVSGSGFVVVAVLSVLLARAHGDGDGGRQALTAVLTGVWGVRLAWHIARRNAGSARTRATPTSPAGRPARSRRTCTGGST